MNSHGTDTTPDPCFERPTFSANRFFIFLPLFLTMIPGSIVLFILLAGHPYGIQFASIVVYSAAVVLYTFSKYRGTSQRYLFSCPIVRGQLYRLTLRHFAFLIALFAIETAALQLRPKMPAWWFIAHGRNTPPFEWTLFTLCGVLLLMQVLTNHSVLKRAHLDHSPD